VINKSDINPEMTDRIEAYLKQQEIPLLEKLPFDTMMVESMIDQKTLVEYNEDSPSARQIKKIWQRLSEFVN
jgi:MinD superfamily P-loop ATPase